MPKVQQVAAGDLNGQGTTQGREIFRTKSFAVGAAYQGGVVPLKAKVKKDVLLLRCDAR